MPVTEGEGSDGQSEKKMPFPLPASLLELSLLHPLLNSRDCKGGKNGLEQPEFEVPPSPSPPTMSLFSFSSTMFGSHTSHPPPWAGTKSH